MSESKSLLLLVRISVALVSITFITLSVTLYRSDQRVLAGLVAAIAVFVLIGGAAFLSRISYKLSTGEVIQDELSIATLYKSAYITFNISIVMWLGIAAFIDAFSETRYAFYTGIFGMFAILFITNTFQRLRFYR